MLRDKPPIQSSMEFVCINELVPEDHLLRKVDKAIDFSFIHPLVQDLSVDCLTIDICADITRSIL